MSELTQAELRQAEVMGLSAKQYAHGKGPPEMDLRLAAASMLSKLAASAGLTPEERTVLRARVTELIADYDADQTAAKANGDPVAARERAVAKASGDLDVARAQFSAVTKAYNLEWRNNGNES